MSVSLTVKMNGGSLPPPPKNTLSQEWEWSESRMGMETPLLINIYGAASMIDILNNV